MDILTAFGLSASAGLNAYIPLLALGLANRYTELVTLAAPFDALSDGWVLAALVVLLTVEVLADKVPAVDHVNDIIGTFVRPAAGAVLFGAATSGAVLQLDPRLALLAGALTAGATHGVKATARPAVTVSTGGAGNPVVSTLEDIAALTTSVAALVAPLLLGLAILAFAFLLALWWLRRRRPGAAGTHADT